MIGIIFENLDQKVSEKSIFCQKIIFHFFGTFWSKFSKIRPESKKKKKKKKLRKPIPRLLSKHDFQAISAFLTQNCVWAVQEFFYQKSDFWPFSKKKIIIFGKI